MPPVKRSTEASRLVFATCEAKRKATPIAMPSTANSSCMIRARRRTRYRRTMLDTLIPAPPRPRSACLQRDVELIHFVPAELPVAQRKHPVGKCSRLWIVRDELHRDIALAARGRHQLQYL